MERWVGGRVGEVDSVGVGAGAMADLGLKREEKTRGVSAVGAFSAGSSGGCRSSGGGCCHILVGVRRLPRRGDAHALAGVRLS